MRFTISSLVPRVFMYEWGRGSDVAFSRNFTSFQLTDVTNVPEPTCLLLLASGSVDLAGLKRKTA